MYDDDQFDKILWFNNQYTVFLFTLYFTDIFSRSSLRIELIEMSDYSEQWQINSLSIRKDNIFYVILNLVLQFLTYSSF